MLQQNIYYFLIYSQLARRIQFVRAQRDFGMGDQAEQKPYQ